jgi:uncharacterized membrane protein
MPSVTSALPSSPPAPQPTAGVQRSRWLALACCIALVLLGLAWELVLAPTGRGTLAIKVLPMLLAVPGLWRMRLYTYRWMSLAVWMYFTEGAVRATSEGGLSAWLAGIEVILSVLLFIACAVHVRARLSATRVGSGVGEGSVAGPV